MEEHVLTEGKLLDKKGNLLEAGYSTSLVKEYDSSKIKAGKEAVLKGSGTFVLTTVNR